MKTALVILGVVALLLLLVFCAGCVTPPDAASQIIDASVLRDLAEDLQ